MFSFFLMALNPIEISYSNMYKSTAEAHTCLVSEVANVGVL